MSVDGNVLGIGTIGGMGGGAASVLAETGNPVLVAILVGGAIILTLGFITRAAQKYES